MGWIADAWDVLSGEKSRRETYARQQEEARQEHEREVIIREMVGSGQQIMLLCGASDVGLYGDDEPYVVLPNTVLHEPRSVRYTIRNSAGTSKRYPGFISTSFTVYSGTSVAQSESQDELRMIGVGDFIITNKRIVFVSELRTISIPFKDIVGTANYADGLRLNKDKREKPYIFSFPSYQLMLANRLFHTNGPLVHMALTQSMLMGKSTIRPPSPPAVRSQRSEVYVPRNFVPKNEPPSTRYHSIFDNQQAVYDLNYQQAAKRWSPWKWAFWIMLAIVVIHTLLK